jgi:hypothetical protein
MIAAPYRERVVDPRALPFALIVPMLGGVLEGTAFHGGLFSKIIVAVPIITLCVIAGAFCLRIVEVTANGIVDRPAIGFQPRKWIWRQLVRAEVAGRRTVRIFFIGGGSADIGTRDPQGLLDAIERFRRGAA